MTGAAPEEDLAITLGVEEEFFLVDPTSRDLISDPDLGIFETCKQNQGPHKVVRELFRSQVETNTKVCRTVAEVRSALCETRQLVVKAAEKYGAAVMASSTHPFAVSKTQVTTPRERYERFTKTFQEVIRLFVVGGMHIHAGFGDPDTRIRVMTAVRRYLPVLHALSASSPFNAGHETGLKSFRLNLVGNLPRTSLPNPMWSRAEFDQLVADYQRMEFIDDASELWWDIRPSHAFPTVEMRICDVCTRLDDAVCMAALYASLVRMLQRLDRDGALPSEPPTEIIAENRWLAQRYGIFAFFGDTVLRAGRVDINDYVVELIETLTPDARALGCETELRHALTILREGTSADRQLDLYRLRRLEGDTEEEALRRVVDLVLSETRDGTDKH